MALLAVILLVAVALFLVKMGTRMASRVAGRTVTERFQAAEALLKRGELPVPWLRDPRLKGAGEKQGRAILRARLEELTRFFATCPYFKDGDARSIMLERLEKIAEQWRAGSPQAWAAQGGK